MRLAEERERHNTLKIFSTYTNTSEKTTSKALYIPEEVLLLLRRREKRTT